MDQDTNIPVLAGHHRTLGNVIAGLSLLIALLVGGWYIFMQQYDAGSPAATPSDTTGAASTEVDTATAAFQVQGTSDEISAIDADLEATDLNSLNDINSI
ncbi:MAG: hypothetical protein A2845_00380 [Candidatus Lloydbacteria bacterium RIFCSPHIGHO2_01_FULL_49_22]|uniref:Uncharacterized protein n=1 Tax=Candidatus Lloydbacteria bacterium RIFCSPHIGHO2_01_FULL_49_22 TaxID=1798658 RepID=A0A1G2CXY5_9BACT|nr:MAG: hypothetical protein A2845_00380 [Candidatus Lloydbacteria bacterium RIFCSPHIGHO2_01_FULL_49_22]OGZ09320.1 MAG: hypothetical protein A3C14_05285 [Candidatus Lloydbacteria bacterium RIFCSPHIGHO2_02_FULL_50_18]